MIPLSQLGIESPMPAGPRETDVLGLPRPRGLPTPTCAEHTPRLQRRCADCYYFEGRGTSSRNGGLRRRLRPLCLSGFTPFFEVSMVSSLHAVAKLASNLVSAAGNDGPARLQ